MQWRSMPPAAVNSSPGNLDDISLTAQFGMPKLCIDGAVATFMGWHGHCRLLGKTSL
jgi:hypothetical protein